MTIGDSCFYISLTSINGNNSIWIRGQWGVPVGGTLDSPSTSRGGNSPVSSEKSSANGLEDTLFEKAGSWALYDLANVFGPVTLEMMGPV